MQHVSALILHPASRLGVRRPPRVAWATQRAPKLRRTGPKVAHLGAAWHPSTALVPHRASDRARPPQAAATLSPPPQAAASLSCTSPTGPAKFQSIGGRERGRTGSAAPTILIPRHEITCHTGGARFPNRGLRRDSARRCLGPRSLCGARST